MGATTRDEAGNNREAVLKIIPKINLLGLPVKCYIIGN